jgi:fluoride exporter
VRHLFFIALGGGLGASLRYLTSKSVQSLFNQLFPYGTLCVNICGSFLIGFLFFLFDHVIVPRDIRSFLTIGFLGAFTTFSTYSLETINLLQEGDIKLGIMNIVVNNVLCLLMVITGLGAARLLLKVVK